MKNPYDIIIRQHITEKATMLGALQTKESNKSIARCKCPKIVFIVDRKATKNDIAYAVETMYKEQNVKVTSVNTLIAKPKPKRRGRGRQGATPLFKKAIVTLEAGDSIEKA